MLAPTQPLLLRAWAYSRKSPRPLQASCYHSLPHSQVSGAVIVCGKRQKVVVEAWLDREWSSALLNPQPATRRARAASASTTAARSWSSRYETGPGARPALLRRHRGRGRRPRLSRAPSICGAAEDVRPGAGLPRHGETR